MSDTNHDVGSFSTRGSYVANHYYRMGSSLNTKKGNSLSPSGIEHCFNCIFFLIFQVCIFEALLNENYFVSPDPHSTTQLSHYSELSTTYTTG